MSQRAVESAAGLVIYPGDYLGDDEIAAASPEAIGVLFLLLLREWKQMGLPTDHRKLARWVRLSPARFARVWAEIGGHFVEREARYYFPRNDIEREKQARRKQQTRNAGLASAAARAQQTGNGESTDVAPHVGETSPRAVNHPSPGLSPDRVTSTTTPGRLDDVPAIWQDLPTFPTVQGWLRGGTNERIDLLTRCLFRVRDGAGDAGVTAFVARLNQVLTEGALVEGTRYAPTASQVEAGMLEWETDTARERPKLNRWTNYLVLPAVRDAKNAKASGDIRPQTADPKTSAVYSAMVLADIRRLTTSNGRTTYIPADGVKALGADVFQAYQAIGGAERLLAMKATDLPWIQKEFHAALMAAQRSQPAASTTTNTAGN